MPGINPGMTNNEVRLLIADELNCPPGKSADLSPFLSSRIAKNIPLSPALKSSA